MSEDRELNIEKKLLMEKLKQAEQGSSVFLLVRERYFDDLHKSMCKMHEMKNGSSFRNRIMGERRTAYFLKKIYAKAVYYLTKPLCSQQAVFNNESFLSCISLRKICRSLEYQNRELKLRQERMETEYKKNQKDLEMKIQRLEELLNTRVEG